MRKSNAIVIALLIVVSLALLGLWLYLGFNQVHMLDLWLSIAWWAMAAVAIGLIVRIEKVRRRKLRTAFVAEGALFNPEAGVVGFEGASPVSVLAKVLDGLKYDMHAKDMPKMGYSYIVRTEGYSKEDSGTNRWNGEVLLAKSGTARRFGNREELEAILNKGTASFA